MSVTINKTVDIDVQIDYVKCNYCGAELNFIAETDSYGDIQIHVDQCEHDHDS